MLKEFKQAVSNEILYYYATLKSREKKEIKEKFPGTSVKLW